MQRIVVGFCSFIFVFQTALAERSSMRGHQAHVHGEARMNLVVSGNEAMVELVIPGDSIFGFEHRPRTDEQKAKVRSELSRLIDLGSKLVIFPPGLACEVGARQIQADVMQEKENAKKKHDHSSKKESDKHSHDHNHDHKKTHGHKHTHDHDNDHSDVTVEYRVTCAKPIAKTKLGVSVGAHYKNIERVRVQVLTDRHQFGLTITGEQGAIAID